MKELKLTPREAEELFNALAGIIAPVVNKPVKKLQGKRK